MKKALHFFWITLVYTLEACLIAGIVFTIAAVLTGCTVEEGTELPTCAELCPNVPSSNPEAFAHCLEAGTCYCGSELEEGTTCTMEAPRAYSTCVTRYGNTTRWQGVQGTAEQAQALLDMEDPNHTHTCTENAQ